MSTNRAFEVDSILIDEKTGLVAFDIDPITVGFSAPIGSLGMRTNGLHYRKTGAADTDWTLIDDQTAAEIEAIVSHDNLLDFLSTEHFLQSAISITLSQVSDSGSAAALNTGILSGNIPLIGAGNVLPTSIMPALTITQTTVVTSEAEQLALTVQEGDVAVRTDLSETYIALNDVNADMGDWQELLSPTSDVTSVFGRTGPVTAEQADYDSFFLTPAEGNAAYLGIGAKAADSELLDGVDGANYARTDIAETFTNDLTVQGAFTSKGIDDNATGERLQLSDNVIQLGAFDTAIFGIRRGLNTGSLQVGGGITNSDANIILRGGQHATLGGDMEFRHGSQIWMYWDESVGDLEFLTGIGAKTTALTITSDQGVELAKHIKFPATQVPSADPNTQDHYEEGDFTPILTDRTNDASSTIAAGFYTKIGGRVFIRFYLQASSVAGMSGAVYFKGFPFISSSVPQSFSSMSSGYGVGLNLSTLSNLSGYMNLNLDELVVRQWNSLAGTSALTAAEWSDNGAAMFGGFYDI